MSQRREQVRPLHAPLPLGMASANGNHAGLAAVGLGGDVVTSAAGSAALAGRTALEDEIRRRLLTPSSSTAVATGLHSILGGHLHNLGQGTSGGSDASSLLASLLLQRQLQSEQEEQERLQRVLALVLRERVSSSNLLAAARSEGVSQGRLEEIQRLLSSGPTPQHQARTSLGRSESDLVSTLLLRRRLQQLAEGQALQQQQLAHRGLLRERLVTDSLLLQNLSREEMSREEKKEDEPADRSCSGNTAHQQLSTFTDVGTKGNTRPSGDLADSLTPRILPTMAPLAPGENGSINGVPPAATSETGTADGEEDDDDSQDSEIETFPLRLFRMVVEAEEEGNGHIVSFVPGGSAFKLHDPDQFTRDIMPRYFTTTRFDSLRRQLNLYNFKRITSGPNRGAYRHKHFVKGDKSRCKRIRRRKKKVPPKKPSLLPAA